jgi:hypothetical protein
VPSWSVRIYILVRFAFLSLGIASFIWGATVLPVFWREAPIERIARHIVRGEPYKIEVLERQIPTLDTIENSKICNPVARWSSAIIRLRILEQVEHAEYRPTHEESLKIALGKSLRSSLSCSAAEPFLWLILYWLETQKDLAPIHLNYLQISYLLGPNEGWIAVKRNPLAFALYDKLPTDLKAQAMTEFISLVRSGFYQQAADIFTTSAWPIHNAILSQLALLPDSNRETFAKILRERGLDIKVPGVETKVPTP